MTYPQLFHNKDNLRWSSQHVWLQSHVPPISIRIHHAQFQPEWTPLNTMYFMHVPLEEVEIISQHLNFIVQIFFNIAPANNSAVEPSTTRMTFYLLRICFSCAFNELDNYSQHIEFVQFELSKLSPSIIFERRHYPLRKHRLHWEMENLFDYPTSDSDPLREIIKCITGTESIQIFSRFARSIETLAKLRALFLHSILGNYTITNHLIGFYPKVCENGKFRQESVVYWQSLHTVSVLRSVYFPERDEHESAYPLHFTRELERLRFISCGSYPTSGSLPFEHGKMLH